MAVAQFSPPTIPIHDPILWPPTQRFELDILSNGASAELMKFKEIHWVTDRLEMWTEEIDGLWRVSCLTDAGLLRWAGAENDWFPPALWEGVEEPQSWLDRLISWPGANTDGILYAYTIDAVPPRTIGQWSPEYLSLVENLIRGSHILLDELIKGHCLFLRLSKYELAKRLGFEDILAGFHALDRLEQGEIHPMIITNTASAISVTQQRVDDAVNGTYYYFRTLKELEEKAKGRG